MKNFFKTLFSDKSFWAAIVALITCVCVALHVPAGSISQISAFVGSIGTLIAYIITNGIQQVAQIKANAQVQAAQTMAAKQDK